MAAVKAKAKAAVAKAAPKPKPLPPAGMREMAKLMNAKVKAK
jgi:hypothetical protein